MKWCELQEYKWNEYVTIAVNRNLSDCEKARRKGFRGFNGIRTRGLCVSAAVLYQSVLWRPIHWRPANLLSSSTRERNETQNEMMWTAGIQMKWVCDHRSESQFKQLQGTEFHFTNLAADICLPKMVAGLISHPKRQFYPPENNGHSSFLHYENFRWHFTNNENVSRTDKYRN